MKIKKQKFITPLLMLSSVVIMLMWFGVVGSVDGQENKETPVAQPEVIEHLGDFIPLDVKFTNKDGQLVALKDVINKPMVLTLVYYRCPNICSPLLQEVSSMVEKCDLEPGTDYDLLTISFDAREKEKLSQIAHNSILGRMEKEIPQDSWNFMTGEEDNILKITEATGFKFLREKEDFAHPAVVIFISEEGKIVRYLHGLEFLPVDFEMAILDAAEGKARGFMRKMQVLCYNYDPEGRRYVFQINRLILGFTLFLAVVFGGYLLLASRKRRKKLVG
jgi:protein SCO1/2